MTLLFTAKLGFMPRIAEYFAKDAGGYFRYYHLVATAGPQLVRIKTIVTWTLGEELGSRNS